MQGCEGTAQALGDARGNLQVTGGASSLEGGRGILEHLVDGILGDVWRQVGHQRIVERDPRRLDLCPTAAQTVDALGKEIQRLTQVPLPGADAAKNALGASG